MKRAEYPDKLCREPLFSPQGLGYSCDLPLMHGGPCASFSIAYQVKLRDAWEAEHPDWRDTPNTSGDIII